jgi:D-lactate dehydrogenase (cytochrome)
MGDTFHDYLKDESQMVGEAESISFPESEADIRSILERIRKHRMSVTIQGGKTGVVGSAVPLRGHIMNLSHMKKVKSFAIAKDGAGFVTVEPGITLLELEKAIGRSETHRTLFWPPDPSESTATVGGVAATDAKGICSHLYGKTASYIAGIRVMNAYGSVRDLEKGQDTVVINGVPRDLLDVYIGGEGMYGVITELTLRLVPKPKEIWGVGFFFAHPDDGMSFADQLKSTSFDVKDADIAAMEYLDQTILRAVERHPGMKTRLKTTPDMAPRISAMVYVEIHGQKEDAIEEIAQTLLKMGSLLNSDIDSTWAFSGESEIDKMRHFLRMAAETAILHIAKVRCNDSRITKLGLDVSLERDGLKSLVKRFEKDLQKEHLNACFWGHIGRNSLQVETLPDSHESYVKGQALLETWAERYPVSIGDAVTFYGIGKLKKSIFRKAVPKTTIGDIIQLKKRLDISKLFNPGNMI